MEQNIVICINREYGSGGRTIGEMLSKDLGYHYYDKEILKLASDDSGINEALFVKADMNYKPGALFRGGSAVYRDELLPPDHAGFTSDQNLFNYQAKVIKQLADTESCIIVGRCASFILRDRPNVVRVFVHAPHDFLMEQAGKVQPLKGKELEKFCAREDKFRADYYKHHTGHDWTDAMNYDLCLDSGKLGFDKCVEAIKAHAKVRFGADVFD